MCRGGGGFVVCIIYMVDLGLQACIRDLLSSAVKRSLLRAWAGVSYSIE